MSLIERIKDEVTIDMVMAEYGATPNWGASSGWRPMNCPFCRDSNGSGSVNVIEGRYLCHQCGAPRDGRSGDVIDVVMYAENFTETRQALTWIERTFL